MPGSPPNSKYFLRRPGSATPALGLAQSFWALTGRDVPVTQALEQACLEGCAYLEVGLSEERLAETRELLQAFPVQLLAQGWATSATDAGVYLQRAADLRAVALNLQLGHAYLTAAQAADLVGEVQRQSDRYGIPLLLETHRARITQDLFRTTELLAHCPDAALALDLSHYIVAGEGFGGSESLFHAHLEPLLRRTTLIHGRISNGQSIQVTAEDNPMLSVVSQQVWQRAMQLWLADAPADAVFLFEPELGPSPYAYMLKRGRETFSRTEESRTLIRMAQHAWAAAYASQNDVLTTS